jgi:DNA-binding NtrC family response regulator
LPGMDGYVLADSIALHRPGIRVLFATGNPSILDSVHREEAAFYWAFLQKPFSLTEAGERVEQTLQAPRVVCG